MTTPASQPGTGAAAKEFLASDFVYADVLVKRAQSGENVMGRLVQGKPEPLAQDEIKVSSNGTRFLSLALKPKDPLPPGKYQIELLLDQQLKVRQDIVISPDPQAKIDQITISDANPGVQADGGIKETLSTSRQVYASAKVKDAPRNAKLSATWLRDGQAIKQETIDVPMRDEKEVSFTLPAGADMLTPGKYAVQFAVNEKPVATREFTVNLAPVKVEQITISSSGPGVQPDGGQKEVPSSAQQLFVSAAVRDVPGNAKLQVTWLRGGEVLRSQDVDLKREATSIGVTFTPDGVIPPGSHAVQFSVNGAVVATREFTVVSSPVVGTMVAAPDVDVLGRPLGRIGGPFPVLTYNVYLSVRIVSAPKGTRLSVEWFLAGQKLFDTEKVLSSDTTDSYWATSIERDQGRSLLPTGNFTAVFRVDGVERQRVGFHIN